MMDVRFLSVLLLASLLVMGCAQPAPLASPTPAPTVLPASPSVAASVEPSPAATPEPAVTVAPTAEPTVEASATPVPAASSVPNMTDFALQVSKAAAKIFNKTIAPQQPDRNTLVIEEFTSSYRYQIYVRPSRTNAWTPFDSVQVITGVDNATHEASVAAEGAGGYYHYDAVMKCFGAKYDVELDLRDFRQTSGNEFYTDLGPRFMAQLVPICPV